MREILLVLFFSIWASRFPAIGETENESFSFAERRWISLWNGKDLSGWQPVGGGIVRFENGEIVLENGSGGSPSAIVSERTYDHFVFHARVKKEGDEGAIFFRSHLQGDEVHGYMIDLALSENDRTCPLYEQGGRGAIAQVSRESSPSQPNKGWVDYEIVASGDHIQVFVDGVPKADLEDPNGRKMGHFALQVRSGEGGRVRWKDIRLLPLRSGEVFESLFDGHDLEAGWYPVGEETWTVRDGAIRGRTGKGGYGWLVSDREYSDFVLSFRYRWKSGNSGVQFRSWLENGTEMHGYQADIDPSIPRMTGALYDEHERGSLSQAAPFVDESYERGRWYHYEISAVGKDIRLYHDGGLTVRFEEFLSDRLPRGILALQVHSAPLDRPVDIEWRDIRIINLEPPSPWE